MNNSSTEKPPYNQLLALNDIVKWSQDRPIWQRDALRQLVQAVAIEDIDLDRLEALCVEGRDDAAFLTEADVAPQNPNGEAVTISKLHSVLGINALAAGQVLDVSGKGITMVYGDNGSGKSGYCRILKHACRSRDNKFTIHPNIDDSGATAQSANIEYDIGELSETLSWSPETEKTASLSQVSIFDSRSANTHVQAENNVAYTPYPMRVLEGLGDLCDALKGRLDERIKQIEEKTPLAISSHLLASDTAAGEYLEKLSAKSDSTELDLLCHLKEAEQRKLETLRSDLSQDPQKVISTLKAQRLRIDQIIKLVEGLTQSLSEDSVAAFQALRKAHSDAKELSRLASEKLFEASPLPQIGSDTWRTLWEAARSFSDNVAYPDKQFPEASTIEDLCVLCQQPLHEEAIARQKTFEGFIKGTTKANEGKLLVTLANRITVLKNSLITDEAMSATDALLREELSLPEVSDKFCDWAKAANARLNMILNNQEAPADITEGPQEALASLTKEYGERVERVQSTQDPKARKKLVDQKQELEDRVLLAGIQKDVKAQIDRDIEISLLKKKAKTTARKSITNKNKELSELLVTDALRDRFAREIAKLDLNSLPMALNKTRDRKAQSFFRVEFVGFPGKPLGEVLSEGEHRCVALAAFLAELVTSRDYSGIVFDDPMSSLDHIYRERVAKRLAEEAQHRQVVIFTHDLSFLFEVIREADELDTPLHYQHVKRRGKIPGYISAELPMKAKNAAAAVAALRTELKALKGQLDTASETQRAILTKGIIEQLREAWDQVIADFISPVLGRFDNKIKGNSLFKLLVLERSDVDYITNARGRLSEGLHNVAGALNLAEVSHDQLFAEVSCIHEFIEDLKKRAKPAPLAVTAF